MIPDKAIIIRIPENTIGSEAVFAPDRHVDGCGRQHEPPPPCGAEPRPMEVISKPFGL